MKFTIALTALASLSVAAAETVSFAAKGALVQGPISSIHEGAGMNYFLIGEGGSGEVFDLENGMATNMQGNFEARIGAVGPYLASGPAVPPSTLDFDGDVANSLNFWACRNTSDPYNYSTRSYIIAVNSKSNTTAPFSECESVSLYKVDASA